MPLPAYLRWDRADRSRPEYRFVIGRSDALGGPPIAPCPRTIPTTTGSTPETGCSCSCKIVTKHVGDYVRTSTTNNKDSIPAQEAACRSYAEQRGFEVEDVYADEGTSGGLDLQDRDALSEAVLAVEEGRAAGLLAHRLDRLAP